MTPLSAAAAAWLALSAAARATPGPLPPAVVERGPDGLELVVQPLPGATWASLRLLVRSGGEDDPPEKGGLAHLVEHLVMQGSADARWLALDDAARAAGAIVNAHTTPSFTKYELDAPAAAFPRLADTLLRMVTSPAWGLAKLATERGVIETEAAYYADAALLSLVDSAVFPSPLQAGPLAGTEASRGNISLDDAIAFFQARYAPDRTTIVLAGAVTPEDGRALVARAYRVPPALPADVSPRAAEAPALPVEQRVAAPVTVMMLGYALAPPDSALCEEIAALVHLRVLRSVLAQGGVVRAVDVDCPRLRGNDFILAMAYTNRLDSGDLQADLDDAFRSVARRPPDARERALVDAHLARVRDRTVTEPDRLAERLAVRAAEGGGRTDLSALFPGRLPGAARLAELGRRSFAADRRVQLSFSPLQE
jgi:zinc protease